MTADRPTSSAPLAGLVVVEVANWLAAPAAGALLADLGARVIKVEQPGGDSYRHVGLRAQADGPRGELNYPFILDNRGKESVTIDLGRPEGTPTLLRLAERADIYLTNMVPARAERYGLTPEILRERHPRLVYAAMTGYGLVGPDANRGGYDNAAFFARSGITALTGGPDAPVQRFRDGLGDHVAALNLLAAILAALRLVEHTGDGQLVDVSLYGSGVWALSADHSIALVDRQQPQKTDRDHPKNPLSNAYRSRDGRWMVFTMSRADRYWPGFCRALDHVELLDDPRFNSLAARREHGAELTQIFDEVFATRDRDEWAERLDAEGIVWGPAAELPEVGVDEQARALGLFDSIEDERVGSYETVGTPFRIGDADIRVRGRAPEPGEHTHELLLEFGFTAEELADLATAGVFG